MKITSVEAIPFAIPYVKWGLKNPSTFILRVDQSVDVEIKASGDIP